MTSKTLPRSDCTLAVQRLGHPVDAEVHLEIAVGQPARHFFADDHVGRHRGGPSSSSSAPSIES